MDGLESAKSYEQVYKSDIHGVLRKDREKENHQNSRIEIRDITGENVLMSSAMRLTGKLAKPGKVEQR